MNVGRRGFCQTAWAALAVGATPFSRAADDASGWPGRPLRIVVGFPPGQSSDILARIYAEELGKELGESVIVENRPGAAATIAAEHVARSPADGYTILCGSTGPIAIAPNLYSHLHYDPVRDFEPIGTGGIVPMVLVVAAGSPFKTLAELIEAGRAENGASINYGSSGAGGTAHLTMELFKLQSGTKFTHVPYKGSSPMLTDLMNRSIQVAFDTTGGTQSMLRSGSLRALGVGTTFRLTDLPNVPAIGETLPGFDASAWGIYLVPKGTPAPIVAKLSAALARVNAKRETKDRLATLSMLVSDRPTSELKPFIQREIAVWGKAVKVSGATVE
jgi:tripartite-type tricarboxylate transporter receptor subunit TctC